MKRLVGCTNGTKEQEEFYEHIQDHHDRYQITCTQVCNLFFAQFKRLVHKNNNLKVDPIVGSVDTLDW